MVYKVGDIAVVSCIHSERAVTIIIVKVKKVGATFSIINLPPSFCFLICDHLQHTDLTSHDIIY